MGNALRAFRDVENVILAAMQSKEELTRLTASIERLKQDKHNAETATATACSAREVAMAALTVAEEDLHRKKEMMLHDRELAAADMATEVERERDLANRKIDAFKENVETFRQQSDEAVKAHEGVMASLHAEIETKTQVLDGIKADIDALKARLG
jgi:chromosome segregation ATPase